MPKRIPDSEIIGKRFGRFTVIKETDPKFFSDGYPARVFLCKCQCGTEKSVLFSALRSGGIKSCGCQRREVSCAKAKKHGMAYSPEFTIWEWINKRCHNPNSYQYKYYGGRGIVVCDEWRHDFLAFFNHVGKRPSKNHSIDRINTNGNYEPGNCKWATRQEQSRNKRNNIILTYEGKSQCISAWAEELGIKVSTLYARVKMGLPDEIVLTAKLYSRNKPQDFFPDVRRFPA